MSIRNIKFLFAFCILAATLACYFPGLSGSFVFDDGVNIVKNPHLRIDDLSLASLGQAATSSDAGPLRRPISMMSFALDYYVSGMDARAFKMTNLGIHLLNGALVFFLVGLLLRLHLKIRGAMQEARNIDWIAMAVCAIWLLHPLNLTAVLYVVQRMASLSAMFSMVGLILYLHGRDLLVDGKRSGWMAILASLFLATPLAMLSKENGALLPFFILAAEALLFRWQTADQRSRFLLMMVVGLTTAVPLLSALYYIALHPIAVTGGYQLRDFSLPERLMTEARVMWFYLQMILLPNMNMLGLHHDDIEISRGLFSPLSTLPAILGLLLLVAGAWAFRNKHPIIAFGVVFFLIGHVLESSVLPLEIAFEHRNYLPMLGILLPLAYYAITPGFHPSSLRWRRVSLIALLILFGGLTAMRANQWSDPFQMKLLEVQRHPLSVRANIDVAAFYDNIPARSNEEAVYFFNKALFHYRQAADILPSGTSGLFGLLVVHAKRGLAIDDNLLRALVLRLSEGPFNPPNVNALIGFARCANSGECTVSPEVVNMLYSAAVSNPTLFGKYRDQVVLEFSQLVSKSQPAIE
jgi:hypothetical protein